MSEFHPHRRKDDNELAELKEMLIALSGQIAGLSTDLATMKPKVTELVTYLERGKGIAWFFKIGLLVLPGASAVVAGIWWLITHLKP